MKNIYENIDKVLSKKEIVPKEEIQRAIEEKNKKGKNIYESLRDLGIISEKKMASVIAEELDVPMIDITNYIIDKALLKQIPENFATKYQCLPLFKIENSLTIAMANPQDIEAIDKIKAKTNCKEIDPAIAVPDDIKKAISKHYASTEEVEKVIDSISEAEKAPSKQIEERDLLELAEEAPIIKLVNLIISRAVEAQASDIHIEPDEKVLRVRYRIDGVLHEVNKPPKHLQGAVVSRIKVLAGMDIAKKYTPQDGRINLKIKGKRLDLRISTFPTINGENVVMRLLDKSSVLKGLEKLGFSKNNLNDFNQRIPRSFAAGSTDYGIIEVCLVNTFTKDIIKR